MSSRKIVFASFYTVKTEDNPILCYEKDVQKLIQSLEDLRLRHDVRKITSLGGWLQNVHFKPTFLLQMLEIHSKADAIVWVDADAVINSFPKLLFGIEEDIAVHFTNDNRRELLTGTVYLRNIPRVHQLVGQWIEGCSKNPTLWEQRVLEEILVGGDSGVSVFNLPAEYCKVYDRVELFDSRRQVDPIIEHFQKSRVFRRDSKLRDLSGVVTSNNPRLGINPRAKAVGQSHQRVGQDRGGRGR